MIEWLYLSRRNMSQSHMQHEKKQKSRSISCQLTNCDMEVHMNQWTSPCGKSCTRWHSSTLAEHSWRPHCVCEHSEAVGGAFQQWYSNLKDKPCSRQPCTTVTPENEECLSQMICTNWLMVWLYWKTVLWSWESALSNSVIVLYLL